MASTTSTQGDWRWCGKCTGLVYFGSAVCPASGVHDHSQSGNYSLRFDKGLGQSNWRRCENCQTLSFTGNGEVGPCPYGGTHDTSRSVNYTLTLDQDGATGQDNWRLCNKCRGLVWPGESLLGRCQAGGEHESNGSSNYTLSLDGNAADGQNQWRWCNKCMMLCYDGYATCAATGAHINVGSGYYTLTRNDPSAPGQNNWRRCNKCYGIAYASGPSLGSCPSTGVHNYDGSDNYVLRYDSYPGSQDHWSCCSKCQLLWYSGNARGRCPQGPGVYHNNSGSRNYALQHLQPTAWRISKPSQQAEGGTSDVHIDKPSSRGDMVYRVQGIPGDLETKRVEGFLRSVLGLEDSVAIKIRSLAIHHEKKTQVATVSFAVTPSGLVPSLLEPNTEYWSIKYTVSEAAEQRYGSLSFDQHFRGLTVLHSVPESDHKIEYTIFSSGELWHDTNHIQHLCSTGPGRTRLRLIQGAKERVYVASRLTP
jgi:hypothetical protein